jgi:hypothetical protein
VNILTEAGNRLKKAEKLGTIIQAIPAESAKLRTKDSVDQLEASMRYRLDLLAVVIFGCLSVSRAAQASSILFGVNFSNQLIQTKTESSLSAIELIEVKASR